MSSSVDRSDVADFGRYLSSVQERDIDLLLMEEFHVSADFTRWFAQQAGVEHALFAGAWHSVTDADGETDLLLRVRTDERVGILIENKIGAPQQDRQAARYHLRAARSQAEAKFDRFIICLCAPERYLAAMPASSGYQISVAYEAIAAWYERGADPRSRWRAKIMHEAIDQSRRGYTMVVNDAVSNFHMEFWTYLQTHHPEFVMRRPTPKGNKSNWIVLKGRGFEPGTELHVKMDQRCVQLGFSRRSIGELLAAAPDLPDDIVARPVGKFTASLEIATPLLDRMQSIADQREAVIAVVSALKRLLPFSTLLKRQSGSRSG